MEVKRITWNELKNFWIKYNHFRVKNKKYVEVIRQLGPYKIEYKNPRCQAYGLFDDRLVGATQLTDWSDEFIRARTIRIEKEYRGNDAGWYLMSTALLDSWDLSKKLFGWYPDFFIWWPLKYGWEIYSDFMEDEYAAEKHCAMIRSLEDLK